MVIEPLGSVMTIQSQTAVRQTESRPAVENTEVSGSEQMANVDATTVSVAKVEPKEGDGADTGAGTREQQQASGDKIKKAVEQLNKSMPHSEAIFGIHDETNRVTIKIINKDTREVIKEIPPEKTLDMIAKVWELAGMLVDEKR